MEEKKENGTRFSRFAQILYKNQPPDERTDKLPEFTLFLLKAGLDESGSVFIEDSYPNLNPRRVMEERVDSKEAEKERARLRLYFNGKRNISTDARMIVYSYKAEHFQREMKKFKKYYPSIQAELEEGGEKLDKKLTATELARLFGEILREAADSLFLRNQNRIKARSKTVQEDTRKEVEKLKKLPEKSIKDTNVAGIARNISMYKEIISKGLSLPLSVNGKPLEFHNFLQGFSYGADWFSF